MTIAMSAKIKKQLSHLSTTDRRRISDTLSHYPNVERKKIWFLSGNVSRVKCGKFRLLIHEERGTQPELVFFGLRNDVYRRAGTTYRKEA